MSFFGEVFTLRCKWRCIMFGQAQRCRLCQLHISFLEFVFHLVQFFRFVSFIDWFLFLSTHRAINDESGIQLKTRHFRLELSAVAPKKVIDCSCFKYACKIFGQIFMWIQQIHKSRQKALTRIYITYLKHCPTQKVLWIRAGLFESWLTLTQD